MTATRKERGFNYDLRDSESDFTAYQIIYDDQRTFHLLSVYNKWNPATIATFEASLGGESGKDIVLTAYEVCTIDIRDHYLALHMSNCFN